MSAGTYSNFVIDNEQFLGGFIETVTQNSRIFNEASRGAIILESGLKKGHYEEEAFFSLISDLVTRRDIASVSTASDLALSMSEFGGVKLNRKVGPVGTTLDSLKKRGIDQSRFSFVVGQQYAKALLKDQVNSIVKAVNAALSFSGWTVDKTGASTTTLTHGHLASTLVKFGDAQSAIIAWIMHSKPYFDLVGQSISDKITNIADLAIMTGQPAGLGRPIIVTDDDSLVDGSNYITLGLVGGAGVVSESEEPTVITEIVTGLENLILRFQGETAYNIKLKGFAWDQSTGGINPLAAAIATQGNWDKVVSDNKDIAGVRLLTT